MWLLLRIHLMLATQRSATRQPPRHKSVNCTADTLAATVVCNRLFGACSTVVIATMQAEDPLFDPLLMELAADLGGPAHTLGTLEAGLQAAQPVSSPPEVQSFSQQFMQTNGFHPMQLTATASLQYQGAPVQLDHAMSLPATWGCGALLGANQLNQMACIAPAGVLHTQPVGLEYAIGATAAVAAANSAQRPANSNSPSSSSGGHQGDDYLDLGDHHRAKKPMNKGALAQKRFRERQKERMRQNEQQVAELTQRLDMLQMEKARLESRARLLEQVVSLNLTHEARLHTNKEIMIREQEMLLEELAEFVLMLDNAAAVAGAGAQGSSLQALLLGVDNLQQQQQQDQLLQQQLSGELPPRSAANGSAASLLTQALHGWNVSAMIDTIFPQYISRLQQLLHTAKSCASSETVQQHMAAAAAAEQEVTKLVLRRREMTDRHALFSHYYWAVWCFNKSEMEASNMQLPPPGSWCNVLQQLQLSREQLKAVAAARRSLLVELQRVSAEWQKVLPTLALQLLQVPKEQWHTVAAVQAMVGNLAAEREAVVAFLHTVIDEVLTPVQEGQLEASSYPWCPDVWAIAGHAADAAAEAASNSVGSADSGNSANCRQSKASRKHQHQEQKDSSSTSAAKDEDPLAALAMGTDVLQPLMPVLTAFQLLRTPVTARGAGLRLKRALLLDPFKTVVPAAAFPQPTAAEVSQMSLLDAHCGAFQKVMLWDWLKANLPGYCSLPGLNAAE